jgi:beta-N-acetylhexosaminidase
MAEEVEKMEFLKREEIKTMQKDISKLREGEAQREREKIVILSKERGEEAKEEKVVIEREEIEEEKQKEEPKERLEEEEKKEIEEELKIPETREEEEKLLEEEGRKTEDQLRVLYEQRESLRLKRDQAEERINQIKSIELEPVLEKEKKIEAGMKEVEERERKMKAFETFEEKQEIERKRWKVDEERRKIEKEKWEVLDRIKKEEMEIKKGEEELRKISEKEKELDKKKEKILKRKEGIELEKKKEDLERILAGILEEKTDLEIKLAEAKRKKAEVSQAYVRISIEENETERKMAELESKEVSALTEEDRREIEKARWELEEKRRETEIERWKAESMKARTEAEAKELNLKYEQLLKKEEGRKKELDEINSLLEDEARRSPFRFAKEKEVKILEKKKLEEIEKKIKEAPPLEIEEEKPPEIQLPKILKGPSPLKKILIRLIIVILCLLIVAFLYWYFKKEKGGASSFSVTKKGVAEEKLIKAAVEKIVFFILTSLPEGFEKRIEELSPLPKIGQLFIVGFEGKAVTPEWKDFFKKYKPGGVLLLSKNIESEEQLKKLISELQELSLKETGLPLFIAVDQEGGEISRIRFLKEKTPQSKIKNEKEAYQTGLKRGEELKELGVNLNLAPLLDLMGSEDFYFYRSFGKDLNKVGNFSKYLILGQKEAGLLTTIKHFPGYVGIDFDPEKKLATLEKLPETSQFKMAMEAKPEFVMTANVIYKEIDPSLPFTFSQKGIQLLKNSLGNNILIISDDLAQDSLIEKFSLKEILLKPIEAGVDVLIFSGWKKPVDEALETFSLAVKKGEVSRERVGEAISKIIKIKKFIKQNYEGKSIQTVKK